MYEEKSAAPLFTALSVFIGGLVAVCVRLSGSEWPVVALWGVIALVCVFIVLACCWVGRGGGVE